jgi:hypothetical protein
MRVRVSAHVRVSGRSEPLPGVQVRFLSGSRRPVVLGRAMSGRDGVASTVIDVPAPSRPWIRAGSDVPEVRAVADVDGKTLVSSLLRQTRGGLSADLPVAFATAVEVGLIARKPRRDPREKSAELISEWRDRLEKDPDDPIGTRLCLSRLVLDVVADMPQPRTRLGRQAAELLDGRMDARTLTGVAKLAAQGRDVIDKSRLAERGCGADLSVDDVTRLVMSGGSGGDVVAALKDRAAPPSETVGPAQKGTPFFDGAVELGKDCQERLNQGQLDDQSTQRLQDLLDDPIPLLADPSVNFVRVYDDSYGRYVRDADFVNKQLTVSQLDPEALWLTDTLDLDVPVDSEECLVLEPDQDEPARQAMLVDVRPGQTVVLYGSGFIGEAARVRLRHRRWAPDVDDGRLVPLPPAFSVSLAEDTLPVHGSGQPAPPVDPEEFVDDVVLFPWPAEATEPGLYEVMLEFDNTEGHITGWTEDPATCQITMESNNTTARLLVAVLPALDDPVVTVAAPQVRCVDETNPEPWPFFDDILFTAQCSLLRWRLDADDPDATTLETLLSRTVDDRHFFASDGEDWLTPTQLFTLLPESGAGGHQLALEDLVAVVLSVDEVEGEMDRQILRGLLIAALVVVLILVVVAAVAVVIALVVAEVITVGLATPIVAIVGTVATALFGTVLTAGLVGIDAAMAAIPFSARVMSAGPSFSGIELASRTSPVRFHRVLYLSPRPAPAGDVATTSDLTDTGLHETYTGSGEGGTYRVTLTVTT